MSRKLLCVLVLSVGSLLVPALVRAAELKPAPQLIPQDAVLVVDLSRPKQLLDLALSEQVFGAIASLPDVAKATANPKFERFKKLVSYLENRLQTDWRTIAGKLLGGNATLAMLPQKALLLVADVADDALLSQIQEIISTLAEADAINRGGPSAITSRTVHGTKVWSAQKGRMAYAISGRRLVAGTSEELVVAALGRAATGAGSLERVPGYQAARKAVGDSTGMAWLNLAALKQAGLGGRKGLEKMNPLVVLLAGGVVEGAGEADWAAARLRVDAMQVSLEAIVPAKPAADSDLTSYAWSSVTGEGALANLTVPRQIASASLYRDLHGFYGNKEKLFPERTGGLVFFENMMGIFFSGRDISDEVLAEAKPEIRVVVAGQQYAGAAPAIQIPGFAVVFRVRHPEQFGDIMEGAWQKALGLINITRGQKAEMGLIIDRPTHNGTQFSMAYFPAVSGEDNEQKALRFNYRPSLVRMGEYYVLSSTDGLAKDLIDALKKEASAPAKPIPGSSTLVEVDGNAVAAVLAANREVLVRQNMLEKAVSQEEAQGKVDLFLSLLGRLGAAKLSIGRTSCDVRASLEVTLK